MLIYVTLWFKKKHRPCQIGVGRLVPLKLGYFQGQQVNLPGCNHQFSYSNDSHAHVEDEKKSARVSRPGGHDLGALFESQTPGGSLKQSHGNCQSWK